MNQPLGNAVGHSNEIIESIETLKGNGPKDLTDLSVALAAHMIHIAGLERSYPRAQLRAWKVLNDGSALREFRKLLKSQGGLETVIDDYSLLPQAEEKTIVTAPKSGHLKMFENEKVGLLLIDLGGGRKMKTDVIDHAVGFMFHKKIGDQVKKGEPLLTSHHHPQQKKLAQEMAVTFQKQVIQISSLKVKKPKLIMEELT
jgi:thymidine phosphorylase